MGDRVVDVQQVELIPFGHFSHARCQRQAVWRVLKERIVRDLDLVIIDSRDARVQPDGIGVSNEVDLVTTIGQLETQFGGDDPAAGRFLPDRSGAVRVCLARPFPFYQGELRSEAGPRPYARLPARPRELTSLEKLDRLKRQGRSATV